jgi:hypothetical protein
VQAWDGTGPREISFTSPALGEDSRLRRVVLVVTDGRTGLPVQAVALGACAAAK